MATFIGSLEDLKGRFDSNGLKGEWSSEGNGKHSFREPGKTGGVINWWETTGTIQIQGKADVKSRLDELVAKAIDGPVGTSIPLSPKTIVKDKKSQIFVVHGHDTESRDQLELVLRRLGLEPFILMNTSGGGLTIIEALEGKIGRDYSADFGIVLLTPDDMGYSKIEGETKSEPRARQNVILETGMLLSSLTRQRMALIVKGHVDLPSDLQGIIQHRYNEHIREIVPKLCQRLREAGFEIDAGKVSDATA